MGLVLGAVAPGAVGGQQIEGVATTDGTVLLVGMAVDSTTGTPLVGAAIYALEQDASAVSDSLGQFALGPLEPGLYRVSFYHERLVALDLPTAPVFLVDLGEPGVVRADLYIPQGAELETLRTQEVAGAQPFVLEPIRISVTRERARADDRQREGAAVSVLERADIESQVETARHIGDLLVGFPSVRVRRVRGALCVESRRTASGAAAVSRIADPCPRQVAVWLDQVPLAEPEYTLAQLRPRDIERVEFLNGLVAGARYGRDAGNGVLVIETRRPN